MFIAAIETNRTHPSSLSSSLIRLHSQGIPDPNQGLNLYNSVHSTTYTANRRRLESTSKGTCVDSLIASSKETISPSRSHRQSMSQQQQSQSNPWNIPGKEWRDMDARSAPFQAGSTKEASSRNTFGTSNPNNIAASASATSPPKTSEAYTPALAAPRAVQPYPRFTSPQPGDTMNRSPSPSKKGSSSTNVSNTGATTTSSSSSATSPFSFTSGTGGNGGVQSDVRERWASLGQAQQSFTSQQPQMLFQQSQQQQQQTQQPAATVSQHSAMSPTHQSVDLSTRKTMTSGPFSNEAFLGYNDIWSNGGGGQNRGVPAAASLQQQQQQQQQQSMHHQQQASISNDHHPPHNSGRSYTMPSSQQPPDLELLNTRFDPSNVHYGREEGPYSALTSAPSNGATLRGGGIDMPPFPGSIPTSGSLSPRSIMQYHQQQLQAQQAIAMQATQHGGNASNVQVNQMTIGGGNANEEITTVFIVGFPDDMSEREFANMFLFAKGFEASTLKIPSGSLSTGPGQRLSEATGAGGPYSAVNMPSSGVFDQNGPPGGWDEHSLSLALSRAGTGDAFPPLGSVPNMGGASSGGNVATGTGPGGKIKQIIGFAKFRTRSEALEARDALNGRKIDAERGCVLKTEMAKKNLHTKQRPVLSVSNAAEGASVAGPSSSVAAPLGSHYGGQQQNALGSTSIDRDPTFVPRQQQIRPDGGQGMPISQGFPSLHQASQAFAGQSNGAMMSPTSEGVYGRSADFFPRNRPLQEASQGQMESIRGPSNGGSGDKWAPLGPLDYYENSQQQQQQPQQQIGQIIKMSGPLPSRGPDWSALGSPPGLYASAAARATDSSTQLNSTKSTSGMTTSGSSGGPLSPFGGDQAGPPSSGHTHKQSISQAQSHPQPLQQQQHQEQREDFGRGESTATGRVTAINTSSTDSNSSSNVNRQGHDVAPAAPVQSPTYQGAEKSNEADRRPQSRVSQRSRQGSRTTSPVNVSASTFVQRFGSLRIDSPNIHQYPRTFSPNPKSPSGEQFPPYKSASSTTTTTNATSPTSPFLDHAHNLPSPTSRSFSIDANPPGNTLFVGNLPGSIISPPATTQLEEALRKLFSAKNGFRQMSFRVKSSGPMCFVEFEDVGCAGRALGEANGETLDGVVKGGLRLSFSKNPLFKSTLPESSNGQGQDATTTKTSTRSKPA